MRCARTTIEHLHVQVVEPLELPLVRGEHALLQLLHDSSVEEAFVRLG